MPRFPSAQGRLNHDPGFHLSCDENLSEGWGPPLAALGSNTSVRRRSFDSRTNSTLTSGPSFRQSPTGRPPGLQMREPPARSSSTATASPSAVGARRGAPPARRPGCRTRFLHDCRRTAARNLIRASVPERVAMLLTGHKSRAIFDRYNIIHEQELLDAGDQLVEYLAQQAQAVPARRRPHTAGAAAPRTASPLRRGSTTEGLRQKIPLDDEFSDLCPQLLDLGLPRGLLPLVVPRRRALLPWHLLCRAGRVVACGDFEPVAVASGRQHGGVVHDPVDDPSATRPSGPCTPGATFS